MRLRRTRRRHGGERKGDDEYLPVEALWEAPAEPADHTITNQLDNHRGRFENPAPGFTTRSVGVAGPETAHGACEPPMHLCTGFLAA